MVIAQRHAGSVHATTLRAPTLIVRALPLGPVEAPCLAERLAIESADGLRAETAMAVLQGRLGLPGALMRELAEHRGDLLAEHGLRRGLMGKLVECGGDLLLLRGELLLMLLSRELLVAALVAEALLTCDAGHHAVVALTRQALPELTLPELALIRLTLSKLALPELAGAELAGSELADA